MLKKISYMYLIIIALSIIACALFFICVFTCRPTKRMPVSVAVEIGSVNSSEVTIYDIE